MSLVRIEFCFFFTLQKEFGVRRLETLKHSRYNITVREDDGNGILIYNGLSGAFAKLTVDEYEKFRSLNFNENDTELIENLKKGAFVIPKDFNELEYIKERYETLKYDASKLGLVIAPTMRCNLSCIYCYQDRSEFDAYPVMSDNIQRALISFVKSIISENGVKTLSVLWYGGEPLLGFSVIKNLTREFLKITDEYGINYVASMVTNGTLITPRVANELYNLKVRAFQITLDGDRDTHNKKRIYKNGKGTFDKIIEAIKTLSEYKDVAVAIRVNVDEEVVKNLDRLLDTIEEGGLKNKVRIYFSKLEEYEHSSHNWHCYIKNLQDYSEIEKHLYKKLVGRKFGLSIYPFPKYLPCGAVRKYGNICIDPEGYIYKCWHEVGIKEKSVGHVSSGFNERLNKWLSYTPLKFEDCESCKLLPVCMGGCPLRAMENSKECISLAYKIENYLRLVYIYKCQRQKEKEQE